MGNVRYGWRVYDDGIEKLAGFSRDGELVYRVTIDVGALPNDGNKYVPHGISGLGQVVHIEGVATNGAGDTIPIPS